ncbi:MAG: hypothetical protein FWG96_07270 [Methanomassiliicoccaceae archaeon]|nr:hypothetical protein [Methanomassiliicoccaceae archaeon]
MSTGTFVFTPKPLVLDVVIQDPNADGGRPFKYPDWNIDEVRYYPSIGGQYDGMFDSIRDALPKYGCEFRSDRFMYTRDMKTYEPEKYEMSLRALTRLTAFIRKNVREMGEFWYVSHWIGCVPDSPENMHIVERNIDEFRFAGEDFDYFRFNTRVFYKFVDVK